MADTQIDGLMFLELNINWLTFTRLNTLLGILTLRIDF